MSLCRYATYSQVAGDWFGSIPAHWQYVPLKRLARLTTGLTPSSEDRSLYSDEPVHGWLCPNDLDESGVPSKATRYLSDRGWSESRAVSAGATLVCCIGSIGKIGFTDGPLATNQQITAAEFSRTRRFFFYAVSAARQAMDARATGNVLRILNAERLGGIPLPCPPEPEAFAIATFLDRETARIDALVAEQERLIELLQEKRRAAIAHAVTQGTTLSFGMRESGIGWASRVPSTWSVLPLRHLVVRLFNGIAETQVEEGPDTVPVTRIESISRGVVDELRLGFVPSDRADERKRLWVGDVLLSNINSLNMIGNCAQYTGGRTLYGGMNLLVLSPAPTVDAAWFFWLLRSSMVRECIESLAKPSINQASVTQTSLKSIALPVPPLTEQRAIALHIEDLTSAVDVLIDTAGKLACALQERRSALISAAVTGQIDVRGLVAA